MELSSTRGSSLSLSLSLLESFVGFSGPFKYMETRNLRSLQGEAKFLF